MSSSANDGAVVEDDSITYVSDEQDTRDAVAADSAAKGARNRQPACGEVPGEKRYRLTRRGTGLLSCALFIHMAGCVL